MNNEPSEYLKQDPEYISLMAESWRLTNEQKTAIHPLKAELLATQLEAVNDQIVALIDKENGGGDGATLDIG